MPTGEAIGDRVRRLVDGSEQPTAELRAIIESISDAVYVGDKNGIWLANQAALDQLGFETNADLHRNMAQLAEEIDVRDLQTGERLHPDELAFAHALRGERFTQEVRVRHRLDGDQRVVRCAASPVVFDGQVVAAVAVNTDVTAQKRGEAENRANEERQAFLLDLSDRLRPLADPIDIQGAVTRALGEFADAHWCYYLEFDEEVTKAIARRDYAAGGVPSMVGEHPLSDMQDMIAHFRSGRTFSGNIATASFVSQRARDQYLGMGIRSFVCTPVVKDGKLKAALNVADVEERDWQPLERLVEEVAERTWQSVERARAEQALRESEEQLRLIVDSARDYAIFTTNSQNIISHWLPGAESVFGWTRAEAEGQPGDILFTPEDRERGEPEHEIETARHEGKAADVRWHLRKDGQLVFIEGQVVPLRGSGPTVSGFLKIGRDATERRAAEQALRWSEERLRQFGEASSDILWMRDAGTMEWTYLTCAFEDIYGLSRQEALAGDNFANWAEMILPEDRDNALKSIARVRGGERAEFEYRIRRPDGTVRWLRDTDFPILDEEGRITSFGGIGQDITALKASEEHQRTLLAELQHRVRNTLAVVRSIARRTAENSDSADDLLAHFLGRLDAFSRVQAALTRNADARVDLASIIDDELVAHAAREGEEVRLSGPDVALPPRTAEGLSLAVHELTTNAVKHGAFSTESGRLDINWRVETDAGADWLLFDWTESGARLDGSPPERRGFGMELLERSLPYDLQAETSVEFAPEGLRFSLKMPLPRR